MSEQIIDVAYKHEDSRRPVKVKLTYIHLMNIYEAIWVTPHARN